MIYFNGKRAALAVLVCIIASTVEGKLQYATQVECPIIDSSCSSNLHIASRVVEPICPSGTEWNQQLNVCFSPCSRLSSPFIKFSVYNKDPSSCIPSCPTGYTFTGVVENKAQCAKCPEGAKLGQSATGVWRCSQSGLPSSIPTIRSRSIRDRTFKGSACPEGAYSDAEGVCHACGNVATPASIAAGAPEAGPFWDGVETDDVEFYAVVFDSAVSGRSAPVCVPEACCVSSTGEYTGEDEAGVEQTPSLEEDSQAVSDDAAPIIGNAQDGIDSSEDVATENDSSQDAVPEANKNGDDDAKDSSSSSNVDDDTSTEETDPEAHLESVDDENNLSALITEGNR